MRTTIRHLGLLAAIVAASAIVPATAAAQQLQTRAHQPNTNAREWVEAADALAGMAQLRPAGDARAVDDLIGAAGAYRIAGRLAAARRTALTAARLALRLHDPDRAAHAYVAAGSLSLELREEESAHEYLSRAAILASSPGLTAQQKRTIVALLRETRREEGKD